MSSHRSRRNFLKSVLAVFGVFFTKQVSPSKADVATKQLKPVRPPYDPDCLCLRTTSVYDSMGRLTAIISPSIEKTIYELTGTTVTMVYDCTKRRHHG